MKAELEPDLFLMSLDMPVAAAGQHHCQVKNASPSFFNHIVKTLLPN